MEIGEPRKAGLHFRLIHAPTPFAVAGSVEIFEEQQDLVALSLDPEALGHSAAGTTALGVVLIPSGLDLVGLKLARVRSIGAPTAGMLRRGGRRNMLHDHTPPVNPLKFIA